MSILSTIAHDRNLIPYRKELNQITGGVTSSILLQQIIYWWHRSGGMPFFKFIEPCGHEKYRAGDSWTEELGFTRKEFITAFSRLEKAGFVSKKTDNTRLTKYTLNADAVSEQIEPIYSVKGFTKSTKRDLPNAQKGFTKSTKRDLPLYTETTTETTTEKCTAAANAAPSAANVPATLPEPLVIESGDRRIEIPGHLKYPGPKTKSHKTWINYAICYQRRYGTWPLWNATTGGMITQLIKRVGEEAAPKVAAHYLNVNDAFVTRQMHPVKLLLADAEMYHTQYMTGRSMTSTRARQIDQTQSNFDTVTEAMAILKAMENKDDGF